MARGACRHSTPYGCRMSTPEVISEAAYARLRRANTDQSEQPIARVCEASGFVPWRPILLLAPSRPEGRALTLRHSAGLASFWKQFLERNLVRRRSKANIRGVAVESFPKRR